MAENRLPAGMRNNNPGNIKYVGQRDSIGPSINTDQGDPQAVYPDAETGMTAAFNLALKKYRAGKTTAADLIAGQGGWTPGNSAAANNIARAAGLSAYTDLNLEDPVAAKRFMRGLVRQEHGNASDAYTDDLIDSAYSKATGAKVTKVADKAPDVDALASEFYTKAPEAAKPSVGNSEVAKLRKDAEFYAKSNPEASRQFSAKADALESKSGANSEAIDVDSLAGEFYTKPAPPPADPTATRGAALEKEIPSANGDINVTNVARATARGVPIIGGALNKLNAATNALIAPIGNQFFSPEEQLKGETFAERYQNSLKQQEGMDEAFKKQNPKTNTALEIGGAIAGTLPVAATAAGARMLGVTGPSLGARALQSAKSGAAISAVDNYIRSGNTDEAVRAGITGGVLGGAIPYIAAGAGEVSRKALEYASPVATRTLNRLGQALDYSKVGIDDLRNAANANPRLRLADIDENVRSIGQGLAAQPGEAQAILRNAVADSASGSKAAVRGAFNEQLGQTPNVPILLDTLKKTTSDNADKAFGDALKNAKPVDLNSLTNNEVKAISNAWDKVLAKFPDPSQARFTQPEAMHLVQQQLRRDAQTLLKGQGNDKLAGQDLMNVRSKLVDAIDKAAGGKFKPAQKQFADDIAVQEAFDKGTSLFKGGASNEIRPDFWAREFAKATPAEKDAIRLGARTAIDNMIGQSKRAISTGTALPESEFNLAKLKTVFGDKEANRLAKLLKDEVEIAKTNAMLTGGSQTEIRRGLVNSLAPKEVTPINQSLTGLSSMVAGGIGMQALNSPLGLAAAAVPVALGTGRNIAQRIGRAVDTASNRDLASLVSSAGPEAQKALNYISERLAAQNRLSGAVQKGVTAVGKGAVPEINAEVERSPLMITVRKKFSGGGSQ